MSQSLLSCYTPQSLLLLNSLLLLLTPCDPSSSEAYQTRHDYCLKSQSQVKYAAFWDKDTSCDAEGAEHLRSSYGAIVEEASSHKWKSAHRYNLRNDDQKACLPWYSCHDTLWVALWSLHSCPLEQAILSSFPTTCGFYCTIDSPKNILIWACQEIQPSISMKEDHGVSRERAPRHLIHKKLAGFEIRR